MVPSAILTSLDIGLSNLSLVHITLSFYTMVKSSAPLFLILFAFAYGIEKPSVRLFSIVTLIAFGVSLTVNGETHFDFHGFMLVFAASIVSGLRWVLTQKLLQHRGEYGLDQPVSSATRWSSKSPSYCTYLVVGGQSAVGHLKRVQTYIYQ